MILPNVRILTDVACEPVSFAEAAEWCKAADTDQALIELLIKAARERAEEITGRAFVQRQLEAVYDAFPVDEVAIELPGAPLLSVEYVKYYDTAGALQTLEGSPDFVQVDTVRQPGRIAPLVGQSWPGTQSDRLEAVKVGYTCGYAFTGSPSNDEQRKALPAVLRLWMEVRVSSFYENRSSLVHGGQFTQPPRDWVDGLLDPLIVRRRFA